MSRAFQQKSWSQRTIVCLLTGACCCLLSAAWALPPWFGDLAADGQPTVLDLVRLINHLRHLEPLRSDYVPFADVNQDGVIDDRDVDYLAQAILGRTNLFPVLDTDGDGLPDVLEPLLGLDPRLRDTDGNGVPDGDEDFDHDGLTNLQEIRADTNPMDPDTDGDGWSDGAEVDPGPDPDHPRPPISDPLDPKSRPPFYIVAQPLVMAALPGPDPSVTNFSGVVAQPLVMVTLPGPDPSVTNFSGIVAQPLVTVALPGPDPSVTNFSGVVAQPLVMVTLPGPDPSVTNFSGVVAQPLVIVANPLARVFESNPRAQIPSKRISSQ